MIYNLVIFNANSNSLITVVKCNGLEVLQAEIMVAQECGNKSFTTWSGEEGTFCFDPKGDTEYSQVHSFLAAYVDWENLGK